MVPLRFITACPNGHINDFPWVMWAHKKKGQGLHTATVCPRPELRLLHTGRAGLEGLIVHCAACDSKRSMVGCAGPAGLIGLQCAGKRPWLGPQGAEQCNSPSSPIVLQRGGSNVYFAKVASSILIPPFTTRIRQIIDDRLVWELLSSGVQAGGIPDEARLQLVADNRRVDLDVLRQAVRQKLTGANLGSLDQTESDYRFAEYSALIGHIGKDEHFVPNPQNLGDYEDWLTEYVEQVVLVERLAETRVLTGFSRINPPSRGTYDEGDIKQLALTRQNWLPAVRVYGEGVFIVLRRDRVREWQTIPRVMARAGELAARQATVAAERNIAARVLPPRFFLLHTLAHLLIRRLAFDAGYGSSSLRERIYCDDSDVERMNGILIYTAAGDCEGTMGGLVQLGKPGRLEQVVRNAIHNAVWCSSDPICIETRGQGTDSLNMAACHACALLPETSCEEGNRLLDRALLTGMPTDPEIGFFKTLIESIA